MYFVKLRNTAVVCGCVGVVVCEKSHPRKYYYGKTVAALETRFSSSSSYFGTLGTKEGGRENLMTNEWALLLLPLFPFLPSAASQEFQGGIDPF